MELNVKDWKEFKLSDLFDIHKYNERKLNISDVKLVPLISATSDNNGVKNYVETDVYEYGNKITISCNGACGDAFYQPSCFMATSDVIVCSPKFKMTERIALFICVIIGEEKCKYNYGRKFKLDKVSNTLIKLPTIYGIEGAITPDFEFMENYIKSLNSQTIKTSINTEREHRSENSLQLDIENWKEFKIKDFFTIKRGRRLKAEDRIKGDIPYFSASKDNNGLTDYISEPLFVENNALIYTTFGDCFYIEKEFTASDEVTILKYDGINKYNAMFIVAILNANKYKYAYGRKAYLNKYEDSIIKLPVRRNEGINYTIDFNFMENYIKKLYYSDKI